MRKLHWIAFLIFLFNQASAATGDSLHFLTPRDTIVLNIDNQGEKSFYHTLEPQQTLFSLARFYGLHLDDVYYYNPHLQDGYEPGQQVKIPLPNKAIRRSWSANYNPKSWVPLMYQVKKGDTFYGIAQRHFKLPVDTICARNHLAPNAQLKIGQNLHVGWISINGIPDSLRSKHISPLWRKSSLNRRQFVSQSNSKKMQQQNGAAYWNREEKGDDKLYALHREAKIGSVLAVTNPMFSRTVYVKVIGRIQDRAHGEDVKVVISPTVAKMLGAVDPKFYVAVKYVR